MVKKLMLSSLLSLSFAFGVTLPNADLVSAASLSDEQGLVLKVGQARTFYAPITIISDPLGCLSIPYPGVLQGVKRGNARVEIGGVRYFVSVFDTYGPPELTKIR